MRCASFMCKLFESILGSLFKYNKNHSAKFKGNGASQSNITVKGDNSGSIAGRDLHITQNPTSPKAPPSSHD
jgi:hypothetical protein